VISEDAANLHTGRMILVHPEIQGVYIGPSRLRTIYTTSGAEIQDGECVTAGWNDK